MSRDHHRPIDALEVRKRAPKKIAAGTMLIIERSYSPRLLKQSCLNSASDASKPHMRTLVLLFMYKAWR